MTLFQSVDEIRRGLNEGVFNAHELAIETIAQCKRANRVLNCFVTIDDEGMLRAAATADAARRGGKAGPLTGIPIAHKDLFCARGVHTTCASRMLESFVAPYDATVVENVSNAGMVSVGKTNMDEFAMGSTNETSYFGPVSNPWQLQHVPGGSSGGSAAAVAAGLVPLATGTDTGGSIRQPAAFCGITGLKPTYGRVSRYGMVAFASSLDQGGPMAHSALDVAALLLAMEGHDPRDSTSADAPATSLHTESRRYSIGYLPQLVQGLSTEVSKSLEDARATLEQQGHRFVDIELSHLDAAVAAYYVISGAEASANLARFDGVRYGHRAPSPVDINDLYSRSRSEGFGQEVKRRILTGTYALSVGYFEAYYLKAQQIRNLVQQDFLRALQQVDLVLAPVTPTPALAKGSITDDPVAMYQQDIFTIPASLAGLPAISLPCGQARGLPLGLQIIGKHFAEAEILDLAIQFQSVSDWHERHPVSEAYLP